MPPSRAAARLVLLAALLATGRAQIGDSSRMVLEVHAPRVADPRKEELALRCEYDLHGQELYSVSWYKNSQPLFMYRPKFPPQDSSAIHNISVVLERSNATHLYLRGHHDYRKNLYAYNGSYACEVSTESPAFLSDIGSVNVTTAILPKKLPVLEGVEPSYQVGEQLEAHCTSAPSLPAAELTLYLNNQKIDWKHTTHRVNPIGDALESTHASVSLTLSRQHFKNGSLRLACRASLPNVPLEREYKTEKTATLAANNQRLAQPPPDLSPAAASEPGLLLFLLLAAAAAVVVGSGYSY